MNANLRKGILFPFVFICCLPLLAQNLRSFNQNEARSNHTRGFSLSFSPLYTLALDDNKDSLLFRGNGGGLRVGGDYFPGNVGIGFLTGFISAKPGSGSINNFLKNNAIPPDQLIITQSTQQSAYLLLGPSFRLGQTVQFLANARAGIFVNSGGLVNIQQKGAIRAAYRNEPGTQSVYPGYQAGIGVQYQGPSQNWSLGLGADFMGSKAVVTNFDARRGGGLEGLKLSQPIREIAAAITLRYFFHSTRDASSGMATGRRVLPTVNKREIVQSNSQNGSSSNSRVLPTVNKKEIVEEIETRIDNASCGPVSRKITHPDGSSEETTFSCPADAASYDRVSTQMPNRISMSTTVPKQTNSTSFGEKVNAGLSSRQGSGIISGNLRWANDNSGAIITNRTMTEGSHTGNQPSLGSRLVISAREAGSGMATGKKTRDAGSGMATGKREFIPVFTEGSADACIGCFVTAKISGVNNNPIYQGGSSSGNNPLGEKSVSSGGIPNITVYLLTADNGDVVARTQSTAGGDFFFANVPTGRYLVRLAAEMAIAKDYDIRLSNAADLEGSASTAEDYIQLSLIASSDQAAPSQKAGVSTSRSNIRTKTLTIVEADLDGDGEFESLRANANFSDGTSIDLPAESISAISNASGNRGFRLTKQSLQMRNQSNGPQAGNNRSISSIQLTNQRNRLTATATLSDGSTADVTEGLVSNTTNAGVRQYSLVLADLDDDGVAEAVVKTKTKSNQSNDRLASGESSSEEIWSPRSNIRLIRISAGDLDGDGQAELQAGNNSAASRRKYFETGDKPTQDVIDNRDDTDPSAARPGSPIGGLSIKGGKNPGGNLRMIQTNPEGKFELNNLEPGDYRFSFSQPFFLDDVTVVEVGDPAENIVTSESNLKSQAMTKGGSVLTASQNSQSLRSRNEEDTDQNQPATRARNNNTVRSNRTDNALIDLDNLSGENNPTDNSSTSGELPEKAAWPMPASARTAANRAASALSSMRMALDQLETQINNDNVTARAIINTSRSNIKNQRAAIVDLENSLESLAVTDRETGLNRLQARVASLNDQFLLLRQQLQQLGDRYTSISNVLKTRHDTVKNSIQNIR